MATRQKERGPNPPLEHPGKRYHKTRWLIASITLVFIALGAGIWILTNRSAFTTILPILIFSVLGVLISLLQWLFPLSSTASERHSAPPQASSAPQNAQALHQTQPIIVHIPTSQALSAPSSVPTTPLYRRITGLPPLTDPRTIQQREQVVKAIYSRLMQADITALALTGIGGAGKSTLACIGYLDYPFQKREAMMAVLPSDMVDNSFSPCERLSGWLSLHSACLIGCFILSLSIPICSQHH